MDEEALQQIEQIIGYRFHNRNLLSKAFTHSSAVDNRFLCNERLEFLGDAVLGIVVCRQLFDSFPGYLEGDLTKIKSMLVSRKTCAKLAKQMGLHKFLKIGKGMANNHSPMSMSLSAGLFEAVIAAIYLDGGFDAAAVFLLRIFAPLIEKADAEQTQGNFKSLLQQYVQQQLNTSPIYELLDEKGPDHNKCFESEVIINGRRFPSAWGTNKKEAEQRAAFNALVELGILEDISAEQFD